MPIDIQVADATPTAVVTPEVVKKYFIIAKSLLAGAKMFAALTKTQDDDLALAKVEQGLAIIEPYLDQQWAYDLVNAVIALFGKGGSTEDVAKALMAAVVAQAALAK